MGGRSLREPLRSTGDGVMSLEDTKRKAAAILEKARKSAQSTRSNANKRERAIDKKIEVINQLLPNGFTPAPNAELLPPQLQRKIARSAQEVVAVTTARDNFIPTPMMRQIVYDYSKFGVSLEDIRLRIVNPMTHKPIDTGTLKRHFAEEIQLGQVDGKVTIAQSAYRMSTYQDAEYDENGKLTKPEVAPNASVLITSLKHRLQWKDNKQVTITHNQGVDSETADALKQLNPDELRTLREFATRRAAEKAEAITESD